MSCRGLTLEELEQYLQNLEDNQSDLESDLISDNVSDGYEMPSGESKSSTTDQDDSGSDIDDMQEHPSESHKMQKSQENTQQETRKGNRSTARGHSGSMTVVRDRKEGSAHIRIYQDPTTAST